MLQPWGRGEQLQAVLHTSGMTALSLSMPDNLLRKLPAMLQAADHGCGMQGAHAAVRPLVAD